MAYGDIYKAWFSAVVAALVDDDGPFTEAAQVEMWADDELGELLPDERLVQALTRSLPHALVSWPAGRADPRAGGGDSQDEEVNFTIHYACGAPGADYTAALEANGTAYWGAYKVHDFILDKIFQLNVTGLNCPVELLDVRGIRTGKKGVIANRLDFMVRYLRTISD